MFEVEVRGEIKKDFDKLVAIFRKKAKFVQEKDRFSLIYTRGFVKNVAEIKNDPVDLRIRITNKKSEVVMKYGIWGAKENRKEISIPIENDKFDDTVELFKLLGWDKGWIMSTKTFVFDYQGIEFALVHSEPGDYFEAEIMVDKHDMVKKAHEKIELACKELGLSLFSEKEFVDFLNMINNVRDRGFDFSKEDFSKIKKRFEEYF